MKKPIHVVQLITGLAIGEIHGGGEMFASRLAQAFDPALVQSTVYCLWRHNTPTEQYWIDELRSSGITVLIGENYKSNFRQALLQGFLSSRNIMRELRPDIIQTHTEPADMIGLLLRMSRAIPYAVRTCHNTLEWSFAEHLGRWMDRLCPVVYDLETAVSPAATERLNMRPVARLIGHKAIYIPNTIDLQRTLQKLTQHDLRAEFGLDTQTALLVFAGRLTQQKGVDILLQALAIVRNEHPTIQLWIVGEGDQRGELEQLCTTLQLDTHVRFLGKRTDVPDLMRVAQLFVLPSRWEGLPTVLMEAMLVGTPIVATKISGNRELIRHKHNGWLCSPDNPAALAEQISVALHTPEAAQQYAAQARLDIQAYTIGRVAAQYTQLYSRR